VGKKVIDKHGDLRANDNAVDALSQSQQAIDEARNGGVSEQQQAA
jgi:hypothetical protein